MTLKQLFSPVTVSEVRDAADRNQLVHYRRGASHARPYPIDWDTAAHIAERQARQPDLLRIMRDGVRIRPDMLKTSKNSAHLSGAALRRLLRQGVSMVAYDIQDFGSDLRDLALDAERHFGCPVSLGLIATFGAGHALKPHWDPEDIICFQVSGRKTWKILGQPQRGKIRVDRQPDPPSEVTREFVMEPGDLSLVPHGHWHCCESEDDNLQFSIILRRRIGLDFIRYLAEKAVDNPLFHRAIPLSRDAGQFAVLEAEWLARFRDFASEGSLMDFVLAGDRSQEIPFCFDRTPPDVGDPAAVLALATQRPIAPPEAPGEPIRMGGATLRTTPAILALVELLNREISLAAPEIFNRLASFFTRDEISSAILALDESCLARFSKPPARGTIDS